MSIDNDENSTDMQQGYSGSSLRRAGGLVEKVSSDEGFIASPERQRDLISLSRKLPVLPRIDRIEGAAIYMEYIEGREGLTPQNARRAGEALRALHESQGYPHPCFTGVDWLIELANQNLARMGCSQRVPAEAAAEYPHDALIHSEPGQFIEQADGAIVFIDFEGIGLGSRCQDLGFIYYITAMEDRPGLYQALIEGYLPAPGMADPARVKRMAGIIALAYAGFGFDFVGPAEGKKRIELGLRLIDI